MLAWGGDNSGGRWLEFLELFLFLIIFLSLKKKDNFRIKWDYYMMGASEWVWGDPSNTQHRIFNFRL